jgi:hypothetical protein
MMKAVNYSAKLMLLSLSFGLLLFSCDKEDDGKEPDDDMPAGSVSVSSFSPEFPIWGDMITIKGKGFGTKKDEIEVFFPGTSTTVESKTKGEVMEVSDTQLKVKIPYHTKPSSLNPDQITPDNQFNNGGSKLVIKIKGETKYTSPGDNVFIWFNAAPFINYGNSIYTIGITTFGYQIIPGEKIRIEGTGFGMTKTEGTLSVNGTAIPIDSIWGGIQQYHLGGGNRFIISSLPATLGSKSNEQKDYTFTYTRLGQTYSRTVKGNSLPKLSITSHTLPALVVGGTSVTDFKITGKHLYANRVSFKSGSTTVTVATTGAALNSAELTAFVPLAELLPYGDKVWQVTLGDTDVGSAVIGGWTIGSVRVKP